MQDHIEKRIELKAPVSRVWRALTDYREFSEWFRVALETPFVAGQQVRGRNMYPGCENLEFALTVQRVEPQRLFTYTWHPYAIDPAVDYSGEPQTLVEFTLTPIAGGTLLVVTESGFAAVPANRRDEAFRKHNEGWAIQLENIARHVGQGI
jgi:uncharacterized protein YndB with AHSA1/START domain